MVAYTEIPDTDVDPESPLTTTLFTRLRDNPKAIAEGSSGAPRVSSKAQDNNANNFFTNFGDGSDGALIYTTNALSPGIYNATTITFNSGDVTLTGNGPLILRATTSITINDGAAINLDGMGGKGGDGSGTYSSEGMGIDTYPTYNLSDSVRQKIDPPIIVGGGGGGGGASYYEFYDGYVGGTAWGATAGGAGVFADRFTAAGYGKDGTAQSSANINDLLSIGYMPSLGGAGGGCGGGVGYAGNNNDGGDGGGLLIMIAPSITMASGASISADGVNGGNSAVSGYGGSGGGGGGVILIIGIDIADSGITTSVAGGTGGTGYAGYIQGGDGGAGVVKTQTIS